MSPSKNNLQAYHFLPIVNLIDFGSSTKISNSSSSCLQETSNWTLNETFEKAFPEIELSAQIPRGEFWILEEF